MELLKLGSTLSHSYRIDRVRLQSPDMVLYEGTDTSDHRVCIKVFRPDLEDPDLSARFERELRGPEVIDVGTANEMRFVVVDLSQHKPTTPSRPPRSVVQPTPPLRASKSTPPPLPARASPSTPPPLPVEIPLVVDEPVVEESPPLAAPPPPLSQEETALEGPASPCPPRRSPVGPVVAILVIAAMTGVGGWWLGHETARGAPAATAPVVPQSE